MAINRKNFSKANLVDKEWNQGLVSFNRINSNYYITRRYYQTKKNAFLNYWQKALKLKQKKDMEDMLKFASESTQRYYEKIYKLWMSAYRQSFQFYPRKEDKRKRLSFVKKSFSWNALNLGYVIPGSSLDDFIKKKNDSTFYQIMGFQSEEVMAQNINNFVYTISNSLTNPLLVDTTGKKGLNLRSKSGVTKSDVAGKRPPTKSDVLIYPSSISMTKDNDGNASYSDGKVSLNMEILTSFDVDTNSNNYDPATLLSSYINYYNGEFAGVGGISQKTYSLKTATDNGWAKFAKSTLIKEQLEDLYRKANYSTGYLTQDFVDLYTIYHISKQLMTLISPTTIAFMDKERFIWIDDLLAEIFFTMKSERGKEEKTHTKRQVKKIEDKDERRKELQKYHRLKGKNLAYRWYRFSMDPKAEIRMYSQQKNNISFMQRIKKAYEENSQYLFVGFEQQIWQL